MLDEIQVPEWVKRGKMFVRRDALDGDDPDHPYNYVRSQYDVDPEDFGISKPFMKSEVLERDRNW